MSLNRTAASWEVLRKANVGQTATVNVAHRLGRSFAMAQLRAPWSFVCELEIRIPDFHTRVPTDFPYKMTQGAARPSAWPLKR
ncbi:hypothetical protein VULLAG_LOCUS12740 [Vulpes lagopus]